MKQLLFLFFFPCFAMAQYPGNAGQKITLGEQTTADGLIWRGVAADTTLTVKSDTAAYFVLDTVNLNLFTYKTSASGAKWRQLGADTAVIAYVNTYGTQTVNGAKTFTSAVTATRFNPTANTATGTGMYLPAANTLGFSTNGTNKITINSVGNVGISATLLSHLDVYRTLQIGLNASMIGRTDIAETGFWSNTFRQSGTGSFLYITSEPASTYTQVKGNHVFTTSISGVANAVQTRNIVMTIDTLQRVGIGTSTPAVQFHTTGAVRFAGLASITDLRTDADGDLFNGSDFNLKNSIDTINFGLSDVMKLKPVSFNWNDEARNINEYKSMGFIAQDVMDVIPNAASTMGDGDMQVDYNAIVATLTKAIQEQQTLIKALEQRILILENK